MLDRTAEAVIVVTDDPDRLAARPEADGLRRRAAELAAVRVEVRVLPAADRPVAHALKRLARRGIGPGLVLLLRGDSGSADADAAPLGPAARRTLTVAVGPLTAGPAEPSGWPGLLAALDEQLIRRRDRRVPAVDEDPAWTLRETGTDRHRRRVTESLFTLGAGGFATRGAVEEDGPGTVPMTLADGVYTGEGPAEHLLPGPCWTALELHPPPTEEVRILDLRTGVLYRRECGPDATVRTLRLVDLTRPGVAAARAEGPPGRLAPGPALCLPAADPAAAEGVAAGSGVADGYHWARVAARGGQGITAVAAQQCHTGGTRHVVDRFAVYAREADGPSPAAVAALRAAQADGFEHLLAEHRAAWARRWRRVDVRIPDDPEAQRGVRFALFQLWCAAGRHDEAAVGARGISGTGYAGHVFWDADVFVLPAVVSMDPGAADAMVRYRLHRLDAARAAAAQCGRRGARFPWESASSGRDVTPRSGYIGGELVPIRTGELEEHITADVAWAAVHAATWSGRPDLLTGAWRPLLVETARYWASRVRTDGAGRAHIDKVIGPDEYHEDVDDSAYTNVMARWNLRTAAALGPAAAGDAERAAWSDLADRLVDGYDPATGRYEQFAGYGALEPLRAIDLAPPPLAADVLLGRDRVAGSQVIKQADVLMLHHLVPQETAPGSLGPNLDFYGPRTSHGSSLSPAISAALLARDRRPDAALALLRLALRLDLEDATGTSGAGLHVATMGGLWQAVLLGFAGVRVESGAMRVDPCLPDAWGALEVRFRCLRRHVRLRLARDAIEIRTDGPLRVRVPGHPPVLVRGTARLPAAREGAP
ncbi:trehalose/maltose hydrolase-like predicted phosphorylase [Krasilnikovia cinnamomea]|uniref:Trehalose/maltose hydrolase-like predicted phosphorylase n=1 Tax=Krasilnikovia cinnamomea TaxID=349313 RepID=A0A4Q7ZUM4_9ACTN|nr:glycosyl hydrolase family 65 protein [Krasilnikovia cinnamomea]RZU54611.1 trehalose/maltose hydrolase-like predicted phosphorylase [Krasilnikovia cinnamomea]